MISLGKNVEGGHTMLLKKHVKTIFLSSILILLSFTNTASAQTTKLYFENNLLPLSYIDNEKNAIYVPLTNFLKVWDMELERTKKP